MKKALFFPLQVSLFTIGCFYTSSSIAQVSSDNTTNTEVDTNNNVSEITGGETRGSNLFHSFQDFSVGTGREAFFNNTNDISNIFGRVTGGNISNIDGAIRANGNANLFLINPAGIIFGENARLDIGGSFYGSSATSILFEGGEFSAADLENPPILTVNAPIGLNFRDNPGDIVNRSITENNDGDVVGLQVASGNNLAFIGGKINFESGNITAKEGNIALGGLSQSGTVELNADGSLTFPENIAKANINFTGSANVNVTGSGGNISLNAQNLNSEGIESGSNFLTAGINRNSSSPEIRAGDISINVAENITLNNAQIVNEVVSGGTGNSGNIIISTGNLEMTNGGVVFASTAGAGNAGNIDITARDTIAIDGENTQGNISSIISAVSAEAEGNAGAINITADRINFTNGGSVFANAQGKGNGGSVNMTARDSIIFDGESSSGIPTGIVNVVLPGAEGNSGDITISTGNLSFTNGARIDSSTESFGNAGAINITATDTITFEGENSQGVVSSAFADVKNEAEGSAGNIDITTANLNFVDGGRLFARARGKGDAGNVTITASDTIRFDGESLESVGGFSLPSGIVNAVDNEAEGNAGDITLTANNVIFANGGQIDASTQGFGNAGEINIFARNSITFNGEGIENGASSAISKVGANATGDAGDITITTGEFNLTNGGNVFASAEGQGDAGNIEIIANSLNLNRGEIIAETNFGEGGEVTLRIEDNLILRNNSTITAQAFEDADGGNIKIDGDFIIAFPNQLSGNGSDIVANADRGNGGNIDIFVESLFGINQRPLNSDTNDINASSKVDGFDGTVSINTFDFNRIQTEADLPENIIENQQTQIQACRNNKMKAQSSFSINGKGGIPAEPESPLDSNNISINGETNPTSAIPQPIETGMEKIQPARGIKVTKSGEVILTAYRTDNGAAAQRLLGIKRNCGRT